MSVDLAEFNMSCEPVVVDKKVKVIMNSPALGDVAGKSFSWALPELARWRDNPKFMGADAHGYYMELEIKNEGEKPFTKPYLEIRPIKSDYLRWWEQPLNKKASNPSEESYVFNVYIHPDNTGFHLFRLRGEYEGHPICTWLFDRELKTDLNSLKDLIDRIYEGRDKEKLLVKVSKIESDAKLTDQSKRDLEWILEKTSQIAVIASFIAGILKFY
ncbi:MAG TPA: hypothetical protein VK444_08470 [Methanobacteriaceae archaeon]|nr:hypothetical protein [Methanobacteriaceae archaeon]